MTTFPRAGSEGTLIYPVFLGMRGCPGRCVYCDQDKLAGSGDFDPEQAVEGVRKFVERHRGRAKQVAFYGGTFTAWEEHFREGLLRAVMAVCDVSTSFRISTHPLYVSDEILAHCKRWNIRTIQLGVQDFNDAVLAASGRVYSGREALEAALRVKNQDFELGVQLMPGLPGWTEASLSENRKVLAELRPHLLRLYPLIVIRGTALEKLYNSGAYLPLSLEEAVSQCADYHPVAESAGIRIIKEGIPSNIDPAEIAGGPWHPAFGELVKAELVARKVLAIDPQEQAVNISRDEIRLLKAHGGAALNKILDWFETRS